MDSVQSDNICSKPVAFLPTDSTQSNLQVVFIVDITGSMGSQIEGVKAMVSEFCAVDREGVDVHIWTYTEDSLNCYVSKSKAKLSSSELVQYTQSIRLCNPPDFPTANAGGGDAPENVVAGVVSLLESFESSQNLLVFLITDAPPHHKAFGSSSEAKAELKWLIDHKFETTDIFELLSLVIESLNVTFVPILYNAAHNNRWYQQAAVLTQGCILVPASHDSKLLANGLSSLLLSFQQVSISRQLENAENMDFSNICTGFSIATIDEDSFEIIETDPSKASIELVATLSS